MTNGSAVEKIANAADSQATTVADVTEAVGEPVTAKSGEESTDLTLRADGNRP